MERIINIILIIAVLAVGFIVFTNAKPVAGYQKISPQDAKEKLKQDNSVILLDVRTREEYEDRHIQGSLLIPLNVLQEEVERKITDKNTTIIVYCRSGNRSKTAVNTLLKMGYKNVYDLGGINSWPYETK